MNELWLVLMHNCREKARAWELEGGVLDPTMTLGSNVTWNGLSILSPCMCSTFMDCAPQSLMTSGCSRESYRAPHLGQSVTHKCSFPSPSTSLFPKSTFSDSNFFPFALRLTYLSPPSDIERTSGK